MKNILMPAVLVAAALSLAACTGDPAPQTKVPATPAEFFNENAVKAVDKDVEVGTAQVDVVWPQGTTLSIPKDALLNPDGTVFVGKARVSVREVRSKSDMILSNVLTVSNGAPLVSGGMFRVDVKSAAGVDLKINPAVGIQAKVPAVGELNKQMQQFVGTDCIDDPVKACQPLPAGESSVNWVPVAGQFGINTSTTPGSYVFSVFNKGWINCDFFYSDPRPKGTIHVGFDGINDANTIMFLLPQGINTVIALYTKDGPNKRKSYTKSLPIGLNAEVVAITFNGGKQYLAHKSIVIADEMTENLTFAEATTADIKAYLSGQ